MGYKIYLHKGEIVQIEFSKTLHHPEKPRYSVAHRIHLRGSLGPYRVQVTFVTHINPKCEIFFLPIFDPKMTYNSKNTWREFDLSQMSETKRKFWVGIREKLKKCQNRFEIFGQLLP